MLLVISNNELKNGNLLNQAKMFISQKTFAETHIAAEEEKRERG